MEMQRDARRRRVPPQLFPTEGWLSCPLGWISPRVSRTGPSGVVIRERPAAALASSIRSGRWSPTRQAMLAALREAKPERDPTGALASDDLLEALRARGFVIAWRGDHGGTMPPLSDVVAKHHAFFRRLLTWSAPSSPPVRAER